MRLNVASNTNQKQKTLVIINGPSTSSVTTESQTLLSTEESSSATSKSLSSQLDSLSLTESNGRDKPRSKTSASISYPTKQQLLAVGKNKLRLKKPQRVFLLNGHEPTSEEEFWAEVREDSVILISCGEDFIGTSTPISSKPSTPLTHPKTKLIDGVLILIYPDSQSLSTSLKRPHVYYEGAELKGPLKGVNFPTTSLREWYLSLNSDNSAGQIDGSTSTSFITDAESHVLKLSMILSSCGSLIPPSDSTTPITVDYIIASIQNDSSTLYHEWAHARYHQDESYRNLCQSEYNSIPETMRTSIQKELKNWNYRDDVTVDEFQAYIVEGPVSVFGKKWIDSVRSLQGRLRGFCGRCPSLE
ncbi:hypothetical protein HDU76_007561 [Blyttiomyces sp. JEL0837]|nr:hypothetical protein HDU76_007561 [Blyttiomyces sp. JEL0837]